MARNEEDEKAQASYRKSNQKRMEVIRNRDQDEAIAIEGERNRINEEREEAERLKEQERAELEAEKRENDDLRRIRLEEARINQERRQRQEQIERTRDQEQANAEAARKAKYDSDADEAYQEEGERNEYRGSAKGKIANFFGKGKYQKPKKDDDSDDDDPKEAKGKGSGLILPKIEFTQKSHLLFWIILPIAVILFLGWYNDDVKQGIFWATFYIFLTFIAYGFVTGVKDDDKTKIWVAVALFIWFLDLWPSGKFSLLDNLLGPPYAGFELPLINEIIKINWLAVFTSGVFFVLLYIDMVRNIIKREYTNFWLAFGGILISNWIIAKYVPNSFKSTFDLSIWIPGSRFWNTILAFCIIALLFLLAYKANKKWMQQIPNFFTNLFMIFVISFFWLNNGWAGNVRALIHAGYIALFGFLYIAKRENQVGWHLLLPLLLIVDFFGYGVLWNSGYLWAQFIPPLVLFVVGYCYFKSENSYALATFIFIVTVILILSLQEIGTGSLSSGELNFIQRTDSNDFTNFFDKFFEKTSAFTRKGLSTATGGYSDQYFGNVENNQFEPLGVYFDRIRVAQPKFYDDEPVTIWGTIKSRTLSDPANINFSCARWEGSKRIWTQTPPDLLYPNNPFTVYTSEEKDVECTFNKEKNNLTKLPVGTNKITLSAQHNFETNAYQKVYFIDKERYRAMTRENLDPLKEFGITDTNPIAIYTNGPVRIATAQADPLIKVSPPEQGDLSPGFGIALENRNKITDKDGKAVGEWEGKIKKIRELVLLLPKGITLLKKSDDTFDCSPVAFKDFQGANCTKSCEDNVGIPCQRACKGTDCRDCETYLARCQRECDSLFKNDAGTVAYNGYQLDTASIRVLDEYKDIDKYKTFNCRLDVNPAVLDNTPITTRYFRIKARYDYSLDKTFSVTVEASPLAAKESASSTALPDYEGTISTRTTAEISGIYYNPSNANEVTYSPMVNSLAQANGISYYLIKAMIQVEDGSWNPNAVNIKVKIPSYGLMQITDDENVPNGCKSDWKTNPESNVECGIMVPAHIRSNAGRC